MMQTIPGVIMSDEPFTLTKLHIEALSALPPGVYLVCSACRRFNPMNTAITLSGDGILCGECTRA